MNLAIVIPTFNRKQLLRNLLNQLKVQEVPAGVETHIIVVADGCTDGTIEMIESEFPAVHVVEGSGTWFYTKSMNEGFKSAKNFNADYILTLNDDIILSDKYIINILAAVNTVEPFSIIGSISFTNTEPHRVFFSGVKKFIVWRQKELKYHKRFLVTDPMSLTGTYPSDLLPGRGMLIPFKALSELNYFDEVFKQYISDYDFCLRARKHGYRVYISYDAKIFSIVEKTGTGATFINTSFLNYCKGFISPYSRLYIPNKALYYFRHGKIILWPVTMIFFFATNLKAYFFNKKIA
jgi:GT2 family glycosyltransferase